MLERFADKDNWFVYFFFKWISWTNMGIYQAEEKYPAYGPSC